MPSDSVRWGIVGPGRIAAAVTDDLALADGGVAHAVASRSIDRARAFADAHDVAVAYGRYGELLADPEVDVVYIATPHRQHHAIALAAIAAGKHLLVEKAFTCTAAGTREIVDAARAAGVFCMEAMWTRFQPAMVRVRELLDDGAVGAVTMARADFGRRTDFDATDRLWDAAQGGGALLDLGVYPVAFLQSVLGAPAALDVVGSTAPNGVDAESTLLWRTAGEAAGVGQCSLLTTTPGAAAVMGTDGWIDVAPPFHHPEALTVHRLSADGHTWRTETVAAPARGAGYVHELDEVHRCLAAGMTESPVMPLDDTVTAMGVLERALHALGVHFDEADVAL